MRERLLLHRGCLGMLLLVASPVIFVAIWKALGLPMAAIALVVAPGVLLCFGVFLWLADFSGRQALLLFALAAAVAAAAVALSSGYSVD